MKKLLYIILCIVIAFSFVGCTKEETAKKTEITINLPTDDTVNGYRTGSDDKISAEDVTVGEINTATAYCGNKSSKKFHKSTCDSVTNMQDSNKIYYETKEEFLENRYTACKKCNP